MKWRILISFTNHMERNPAEVRTDNAEEQKKEKIVLAPEGKETISFNEEDETIRGVDIGNA